jgi:ribonuclease VapC
VIVASSALCAVVFQEPGFEAFEHALATGEPTIGSPTCTETAVVISHRLGGAGGEVVLGAMLDRFGIEVLPFEDRHWRFASAAYARFGRGRHEAALNFGDCLAYALAVDLGQPLLYKGTDFRLTGVESVL